MWEKTTILIKFSQAEYYAGDHVTGEVVLHFPRSVKEIRSLDLYAWCVEECKWSEGVDALALTNGVLNRIGENQCSQLTFEGKNLAYFKKIPLLSPSTTTMHQGRLDFHESSYFYSSSCSSPGTYVIPFAYDLPFKVPASTEFLGCYLHILVTHMCHVCLSWSINPDTTKKEFLSVSDQLHFVEHYNKLMDRLSPPATAATQLTVIESPSHQPSLKPYSYQCIYSLQSMLFSKSELTISIKKQPRAFFPGEVACITLEVLNQTSSLLCCLFLTLRHILTVKSSSGIYRELVYPVCRLSKPVHIPGRTNDSPEPICVPFFLPAWLTPTSHGLSVTSEWDIVVSCCYSRTYGLQKKITHEDLNVPLCIWPRTVHLASQQKNFSRSTLFNSNIKIQSNDDNISKDKVKPSSTILESIVPQDIKTTLLPLKVLNTGSDEKASTIQSSVELTPWTQREPSLKSCSSENNMTYVVYSIVQDSGVLFSTELLNSIYQENRSLIKLSNSHAKQRSITRMKRCISPIQS